METSPLPLSLEEGFEHQAIKSVAVYSEYFLVICRHGTKT